ncbi:hypothetical protein [Synechococcus sp. MIT S1220]|uniref:hypothetical protein n=1 Tax=Synechococcus sp. MIT S1220 TaxID=3082549 RepID=UPI0039AE9C4A
MHYSWEEHQNLADAVAASSNSNLGTALALMGVGCLILSRDLLSESLKKAQHVDRTSEINQKRLDNRAS